MLLPTVASVIASDEERQLLQAAQNAMMGLMNNIETQERAAQRAGATQAQLKGLSDLNASIAAKTAELAATAAMGNSAQMQRARNYALGLQNENAALSAAASQQAAKSPSTPYWDMTRERWMTTERSVVTSYKPAPSLPEADGEIPPRAISFED